MRTRRSRALVVAGVVALAAGAGCSGAPRPMAPLLTAPRTLALDGTEVTTARACVDASAMAAHERIDALADEVFAEAGLRPPVAAGDPSCEWTLRLVDDELAPEEFRAATALTGAHAATTMIAAASERGALFGLRTALQFFVGHSGADGQSVRSGTLADAPAFARRGILEALYGPTYSPEKRDQLIVLSGLLRQNTYIYGPKDADPFTHARWRDPYDAGWSAVVTRAAATAKRNLVDFVWAVTPGYVGGPIYQSRSIHYAGDEDFARLVAKTEDLRALGVERFALLLDDVPTEFAWPEDAAKFPSLAAAHAELINRWDEYLMATGAPEHLWVAGSKYTSDSNNWLSGDGWRDYNSTLAASIDPGVQLFWTGPQVYAARIGMGDVEAIDDTVARKVLLWDNWPRRPVALDGRAAQLPAAAAGLLSNFVMDDDRWIPAVSVHDFEQSLGTIADYEWRPESYEPAASLARWQPVLDPLLARLPR